MGGSREEIASRAREQRLRARKGLLRQQTSGLAPGAVQGNVAIMPARYAADFLRFCQLNPKPCPLLAVGAPGNPALAELGDVDIRTDVPMYRIFRDGVFAEDVPDILDIWSDDLVTFAIGCSFSFEEALVQAGVPLRHLEEGRDVSIYRTSLETRSAGVFGGPLVVSMRPFKAADAIRAIQITTRFPNVHGAPVHMGDPSLIGIADIDKPEWGDVTSINEGEIPLFWACGVTPQVVIESARLPFFITHKPSHMLITDLANAGLASL
jgi:uncharacterized protein YcsI (UPF0317 family)